MGAKLLQGKAHPSPFQRPANGWCLPCLAHLAPHIVGQVLLRSASLWRW